MKSKLSLKVLGVVVTIATLASLLVGLTAAPVSAANQMVFTPYSLPSNIGYFIGGAGTPSFASGAATTTSFIGAANTNPVIAAVTASADGNAIYAWDDTAKVLYYSSNAGKSYTALAFNPAGGLFAGTFVGLEVSPKFATDGTVVLVTSSQVWLITGGLANAVSVTGDLSTKLEGGTITAMDVGNYYTNGVLSVYIGVTGGAGLISNVLVFQQGGFTWAEVGTMKIGSVSFASTLANGTGTVSATTLTTSPQTVTIGLPSTVVVAAGTGTVASAWAGSVDTVTVGIPTIAITAGTATVSATTQTVLSQAVTVGVGTFTVTMPAGLAGTATAGTATLSVSPVTLPAGATTTVTATAGGTVTIAVTTTPSFTVALPAGVTGTAATGTATLATGGTLAANTVNTVTVSTLGTITVTIGTITFTVTTPAGVTGTVANGTGTVSLGGTLAAATVNTVTLSNVGTVTITTSGAALDPAVLAIKLSPNYQSDAEVMAVYNLGSQTYLGSNIAALGWNNSILPMVLIPGTNATAVIAAGTDYFANSTGTVLVGTTTGLYIVKGRVAAAGSVTNILTTPVSAIAVQGPLATSTVVVASPGTTALNITTAVTASTVTWVGSAAYRAATGTAVTSLWYAGTSNAKLFASSTGFVATSSNGGAINLSMDNANTFNQIGLISVTALTNLNPGITIISDTNWLSALGNNAGFCQSTDKGVSWVRIFGQTWGGNNAGAGGPARSQSYATNNTWVITNGSNIALLSSNGGSTYSPIGSPIAIGSFNYIENDAYYIVSAGGDPAGIYFSSRPYVNATFTPAIVNINNVARSGKDATHMTFAVGSRAGTVYQSTDGAVTFTQVGTGTGPFTSSDRVKVSYSSDGTLYAFANTPTTTTTGIYMWLPATSSWLNIAAAITKPIKSWTIAADGTAYAIVDDGAGVMGYGIYRSLNYNAVNPDNSSGASWGEIYQYNFPGGSATASIGSSSVGYPGAATTFSTAGVPVAGGNWTAGVGVFASAATGNTLQITENTSTVSGSGINQAIYTFVDAYTSGPVVISPKDKTILTTDTSVSMNWTAMNGPTGGSTPGATNYEVQLTNSADFSGATTPVSGTILGAMDVYQAGNTLASMNVNPGGGSNALKSGTNYTWRVRAISPLFSRWTTQTFTTALSTIVNTAVNSTPANGATGVDVNTTFTWPSVAGANVTYEFVIAEETGQTDKFAIIDYSATTPTNATPLRETLKYNTQYWWRVRATNGTVTSAWSTFFFTTAAAPVPTSTGSGSGTIVLPTPTSTIITITNPVTSFTITQPSTNNNSIPPALLWAVIAIGAILIIAVIVLIVRTRRIP
jgi:hypothetical protein